MAEQFKPGDLVECVDADECPYGYGHSLIAGGVYAVASTHISPRGTPSLHLAEKLTPNPLGFRAARFRLYRSPSIDALIRQCSDPADGEESRDGATRKIRERA